MPIAVEVIVVSSQRRVKNRSKIEREKSALSLSLSLLLGQYIFKMASSSIAKVVVVVRTHTLSLTLFFSKQKSITLARWSKWLGKRAHDGNKPLNKKNNNNKTETEASKQHKTIGMHAHKHKIIVYSIYTSEQVKTTPFTPNTYTYIYI